MAEINQEVKEEPAKQPKQAPRAGLDLEEEDNMTSFIEVCRWLQASHLQAVSRHPQNVLLAEGSCARHELSQVADA